MSAPIDLHSVIFPHTFTLFIGPEETIPEALSILMSRQRGMTLYRCGNYPAIIPKLTAYSDKIRVRRALTVYQIQSVLAEAAESLILFKHDRGLYDDNADFLPYIGEFCQHNAKEGGSVFLFGPRLDTWLIQFESYVNRMVLIIENQVPVKQIRKPSTSTQKVLEGCW